MLEVDDFLVIGSLLLGGGYAVAAFRGGGDRDGYGKGLRYFAVGVFVMLILPDAVSVVLQSGRSVAVGLLFAVICRIVGALFWLASFKLLCRSLMERTRGE